MNPIETRENWEENLIRTFTRIMDHHEDFDDISSALLDIQIGDYFAELLHKLKSKLVDMDLIQTIEENPSTLFEIHGLLLKLQKLNASDSTAIFVLDFAPFLEQVVQVVNLKKYYAGQIERKIKILLHQHGLVSKSQSQVS
ncbi:unnamed protein product [Vicia faba]|uniref:Uncharacterized protein n=1 Tax=Vicia faba TaxID=3906 RepID=A0AAV0ZH95_VICFA|nr:unnamed protein product [Vicia faba]